MCMLDKQPYFLIALKFGNSGGVVFTAYFCDMLGVQPSFWVIWGQTGGAYYFNE